MFRKSIRTIFLRNGALSIVKQKKRMYINIFLISLLFFLFSISLLSNLEFPLIFNSDPIWPERSPLEDIEKSDEKKE